jgi:hypothetical protein
MKSHTNMFSQYETVREAYEGFLKNQKDDTRKFHACGFIGTVLLVLAVSPPAYIHLPFGGLLITGILFLLQALIIFIDMSNRNSMLHLIDYMHAHGGQKRN